MKPALGKRYTVTARDGIAKRRFDGIMDWQFNDDCSILSLYRSKQAATVPPAVVLNVESFDTVEFSEVE